MPELNQLLRSLDFPQLHPVYGRASVADLFPKGQRCGIYILRFLDGQVYAGQSVDVTRRYVQHCKTHSDIADISFKQVARDKLNGEEQLAIKTLEQNRFQLRNITFTSIPKGESDFDLVMPVEDQQRWLDDLGYQDFSGTRAQDNALRRKYQRKFQRFLKLPEAESAVTILRCYVQQGIPVPLRSEISFWSCTCLPGSSTSPDILYARININWQEVFAIFTYQGVVVTTLQLALSPLEHIFGNPLRRLRLRWKYPGLARKNHIYQSGGFDQVRLEIKEVNAALKLLEEDAVIRAIRLFNMRLMKKGPCTFGRYHCMDLADKIIDSSQKQ